MSTPSRWRVWARGLWFPLWWLAVLGVLLLTSPRLRPATWQVGDVAATDILAPYSVQYPSQVLTERAREEAARAVGKVYDPLDPAIARRQLERLQAALRYIDAVRNDPYATPEEKVLDLLRLKEVNLSPDEARQILNLDDEAWNRVKREAQRVLIEVMQAPIREDRVDEARRAVSARVSFDLTPIQARLVEKLAAAFVAPNVLYNPQRTAEAQEEARRSVQPVVRAFRRGEIVVPRGKVLDEADLEALEHFGMLAPQRRGLVIAAYSLLVALLALVTAIFWKRRRPVLPGGRAKALALGGHVLILAAARSLLPGHVVLPYLFPLGLYALVLALFWDSATTMLLSATLTVLVVYDLPRALELAVFYGLAPWPAALWLRRRGGRLSSFAQAGALMALSLVLAVLAFRLPDPRTDWLGLATLALAAVANAGLSASAALLLQYTLAPLLGRITPQHLLDLARPDHPLLQHLLRRAPGTYQHSLLVANMAEQAAERVGADPLLTRVGALYHDVGKAEKPHYFIENIPPGGPDPHASLTPQQSSAIIRSHVPDGLRLAREYRLPARLHDFIAEHHGTTITRYQYTQALQQAADPSQVNIEDFRYPGPKPRSKETGILMLADGCEARARSQRPATPEALRELVHDQIMRRLNEGQLDDAPLTLRDLSVIEDAFVEVLQGTYHQRVQYPEVEPKAGPARPREPEPDPQTTRAEAPHAGVGTD
ncbi:MAG: HDIG domain-containing protein [Chloroflexi bacterium]|nr:HDIG domain-containing protein [Chloroflexota bacterium]